MDSEMLLILQKSIDDWCRANQTLITDLESHKRTSEMSADLFNELQQLGVLHILFDKSCRHDLALVAGAAYQFSRYSPSIALMLVQQNMASYLLAETKNEEPKGWIAMPLYDAAIEWPFRLDIRHNKAHISVDSIWKGIPLLPEASALLLPVCAKNKSEFKLLRLDLTMIHDERLKCSPSGQMLGLRGCSFGDLQLRHFELSDELVLMQGNADLDKIERLWSQAEVCMMALRSGIYESAYLTARDYAKERWQGGKYIIEHSLIRKMLADLYQEKCSMHESWQTVAASLLPESKLSHGQMGLALHGGERLPWACSDGIQLLGGNGYMEDYIQARCFRDAKQCESLLGHPQVRSFHLWETEAYA